MMSASRRLCRRTLESAGNCREHHRLTSYGTLFHLVRPELPLEKVVVGASGFEPGAPFVHVTLLTQVPDEISLHYLHVSKVTDMLCMLRGLLLVVSPAPS